MNDPEKTLALGAGRNEIFESLAVAIGLGGSMVSFEAARVTALLEQRGLAQPKTDPVA